ncbi:glycosyltransferase family 4 protein [Demequina sp. SO4-18]|uniref:glycosyltransferase family 4 protein n=1 Tax=Demequina sp. SO4-18 TaxID=3401026 RepID=UPI003B58DB23
MRICFVADESIYRPAGVQYYVLDLAVWLIDRGHDVTVLHSANADVPQRDIDPRIRVVEIAKGVEVPFFAPNGGVSVFPGAASRAIVRDELERGDFDVVHFQYPFSPLVSGVVIRQLRHLERRTGRRPRAVATLHVYVEEHKVRIAANRVLAAVQRRSIRRLDAVVDTGTPTAHYSEKYLGRTSVHIPIGIPAPATVAPPRSGQPRRVLFLGRLQERKGVLQFIDALSKVRPRELVSQARVTIAGDGREWEAAHEAVKEAGLDVEFVGAVNEEKSALYDEADLAVFPTLYGETFGIVLLEAMSRRAVCVGYANVGYASTMGELASDYLVPPHDSDALAALITRVLTMNDRELEDCKDQQRAYFDAHYDIDEVYPALLDVYAGTTPVRET